METVTEQPMKKKKKIFEVPNRWSKSLRTQGTRLPLGEKTFNDDDDDDKGKWNDVTFSHNRRRSK